MTADPIDLVLVDGSPVSKSAARAFDKSRVRIRVADANEIRNTKFSGRFGGLYKVDTQVNFDIDTLDTTTPDDPAGVNCIIDADGNRWKPVSGVPAPTTESLGGVYSHAAESHKFLTGIGADGVVTSEQPGAEDLTDGVTGTGAVVRANSPEITTPTGIVKADVGLGDVDNTSDATKNAAAVTLTNKTISATDNTITDLTTVEFAANVVDDDTALAANSDTRLATQKATKAYVDALLNANDAMQFKGVIDCSANPNYPTADAGHVYRVSVEGKIGGASGIAVEAGDQLLCILDSSSSGNQATVGANWSITQANIDGAMIGPASAADSRVVLFDGTTGKQTKDSGKIVPAGAIVGTSDAQTLTNKALTAPDINGGTADALTSLGIRSTGAAFDLQMASAEMFTGNRKLSWTLGNADRSISLGGNVSLAGAFTISGAYSVTFTATGVTAVTLPTSGTLATLAGTETLTGKTINAADNTLSNISTTMFASGVIDVDGNLAANSDTKLATQKAVKTYVDNNGGSGGGLTATDRQNFLLSTAYQSKSFAEYRRLVNLFATGFKGANDTANGINTGASSNYSVNASSGYAAPTAAAGTVTYSGGNPPAQAASAGFQSAGPTFFNETGALPNSVTIASVGMYADAACTLTMKIVKKNSSTNVDVVVSQAFSHPGGGWADVTLSSPYAVPASGSYYVGAYFGTNPSIKYNSGQTYLKAVSDITGTSQTVSEATGNVPSFRATQVSTVNSMTLVTTAQTADSSVSNGRVLIECDNSALPTLNTDLTVEVTCDGGSNWAAATLSSVTAYSQGGRSVAETADTACTAGTSFAARIKTLNNKSVTIYAATLAVH